LYGFALLRFGAVPAAADRRRRRMYEYRCCILLRVCTHHEVVDFDYRIRTHIYSIPTNIILLSYRRKMSLTWDVAEFVEPINVVESLATSCNRYYNISVLDVCQKCADFSKPVGRSEYCSLVKSSSREEQTDRFSVKNSRELSVGHYTGPTENKKIVYAGGAHKIIS